METSLSPQTPAGWYADPLQRAEFRWWAGPGWTYRVAVGGQIYTDSSDMSSVVAPTGWVSMGTDPERPPRGLTPSPPPSPNVVRGAPRELTQVTMSAGTAFKIGFFGAFGWLGANLILAAIGLLLVVVFGTCMLAAFRPSG